MSKKIGRPRQLSHEMILGAALNAAAADPTAAVTMNGLARHLNVTPMAIYGYFASRDELLQAMSRRLLDTLVFEIDDALSPLDAFEAWAHTIRRHFLARPELINMLAWDDGHSSIAWINCSDHLFRALTALGLDEDDWPVVTLSIWNIVMSAIKFELYDRDSKARMSDEEYDRLDPAVIGPVGKLRAFLTEADDHDRLFAFQVAMLSDRLARITEGKAR